MPVSPSAKPAEMLRKPSGNGEICLLPSTSRVPRAEDQHPGQRDDEGRNTEIGDPISLPCADNAADDQDQQHPQPDRQAHIDDEDTRQRTGEPDHRADGQVDVTGDDDDHHADGQNEDVAVLHHQVGDVLWGENGALGEHGKQRENGQERDENPALPEPLPGRGEEITARRRRGRRCARFGHNARGHGQPFLVDRSWE